MYLPPAHGQNGITALTGGKVYTSTGWQEAVVFNDETILAVGSTAAVMADYQGQATVIDLGGRVVLPGLHDMHVHPMMAGLAMRECAFPQGSSPEKILAQVAECVSETPPGEWITGGQWAGNSFGDTQPTKAMLDRVAPNNPVMLTDISGHSSWANTRALAIGGITRDTSDPDGGLIERDTFGEPTGLLRESAMAILQQHIPQPSLQKRAEALESALDDLMRQGVTSIVDALVDPDTLEAYAYLVARNRLRMKVRGCLVYGEAWGNTDWFNRELARRADYTSEYFSLDCVKVFMDGVPTESHTAAMLEPYRGVDPENESPARAFGLLLVKADELASLVTRLDADGITVKFHAAGDRAARAALDAIEAARGVNGLPGQRHDVGHLTFIAPADIQRAKTLGATLEYSPYLWFPTVINDDIAAAIGPERLTRVWPVREGIESGALVVVGSDWPAGTPSNNPWVGIETLVTRRQPGAGEGDSSFGPAQSITLEQALAIYTGNGAAQLSRGHQYGGIQPGMMPYVIVVSDFLSTSINEIHTTQVDTVYVQGRRVEMGSD
jgi:hypothetical protein